MQPLVINTLNTPNAESNTNKSSAQFSVTFNFLSDLKLQVNIHTASFSTHTHKTTKQKKKKNNTETEQSKNFSFWVFLYTCSWSRIAHGKRSVTDTRRSFSGPH